MTGLEWLSVEDACDLLRVPEENAGIIEQHAETVPYYVEIVTGYPAERIVTGDCSEVAKQLCRFILQLWVDPDGTDATKLTRVVTSLTRVLKAAVIAEGLDEG